MTAPEDLKETPGGLLRRWLHDDRPAGPEDAEPATTHVVQVPATVPAAGLARSLRQFESGRVVVAFRPAAPQPQAAATGEWAELQRESVTPEELGLVQMQMLRRQAEAQGIQVAVVARDARIRQQAADAGLPVFGSVEGARSHPWHQGRSRLDYQPPSPSRDVREPVSERRRGLLASRFRRVALARGDSRPLPAVLELVALAVVLALCVVAVSGLVAFVVPVASVTLVPAQEPLTARVSLVARSDVEEPDLANGLVPARRIGQRVESEGTIQATGSRSAPDQPASGLVVFTNRSSSPVEIPAGTVVATSTGSNVRFQTSEPAQLAGGTGAQVAVPVQAAEPGPAGNVRAGSINTVEGSLGVALSVINPDATGGGTVKQVAVVTQGDKDRLRNQVLQQVTQNAYQALGELLDEGEFVPPETVGTIVVAETYDRFTDEEADQVSLRLRLLATALAVDGAAANEAAYQALGEKIPRRGQLLADSVEYTQGPVTVTETDDATEMAFDVAASGVVVLDIDPAAVRSAIRGQSPEDAVATLQRTYRLQSPPELSLGPEWLLPVLRRVDFDWLPLPVADRVPWLTFRTQVRVEFEG